MTEARESDLESIAEIYGHYVRHSLATFDEVAPPVDAWRHKLEDVRARGLPFLVVRDAGAVLGFAYAAPFRPKPAYRYTVEDTVYVAPGQGGRGIGRLLLTDVIRRSAEAGMNRMIAVITDVGDPASARLHRGLGFTEAGRLTAVGYKQDRWIDTVLLQRDLARDAR
ncbi:GNAT family N-acetyltransferase [Amorphoplanes digitatis]|uniref:Phosphinothricin acetyltransferase n=1 Tax=Actinoplanes digitatis TaxID=1868 RepID=A0A7W7HZS5_9ACTN|nr:GNAT family N-acetyltransferase [Actinoplanes digitatis]MBB4763812.1 phosphinothricin acetyltransferase [Actinoplanes digitatis]GID95708.1 N-acetyltransferase [Actinoplanes digitatis]